MYDGIGSRDCQFGDCRRIHSPLHRDEQMMHTLTTTGRQRLALNVLTLGVWGRKDGAEDDQLCHRMLE